MIRSYRLQHIRDHPELHNQHTFEELILCCTVEGVIDFALMDAHPIIGHNGGKWCDVLVGPCSCGGWHSIEDNKTTGSSTNI